MVATGAASHVSVSLHLHEVEARDVQLEKVLGGHLVQHYGVEPLEELQRGATLHGGAVAAVLDVGAIRLGDIVLVDVARALVQ